MKKLFTLLTMLIVAITSSWAVTPVTKTYGSQTFLDVTNTTKNVTVGTTNYVTLLRTDFSGAWYTGGTSNTGSVSGSFNAETMPGFFGDSGWNAAYTIRQASGYNRPFFVTGTTGVAILGNDNSSSDANKKLNIVVEEVAENGDLTSVGSTAGTGNTSVYVLEYTASTLAADKYYKITITATGANTGNNRLAQIRFTQPSSTPAGPSISADDVEIANTATTEGEIAFTVANPVTGGAVTAAKKTTADWLTLGTVANGKVPFSATANTGEERTATVTLTYTYTEDETEKTVPKDVTITQAAATYAVTYNKGAYGTGSIAAGEKSYGVDFTLSSSTFSREGYAQTGWATTDGGEKVYDLGGTYIANAAIELFPVWTASYTYTADFSDYTKGVPAGWAFSYDSTNKFATSNGNTSTTDFVGTMKDNGQTTPSSQASINDNWVAFGKKDGGNTNDAYAILDLGVTTTVYGMNATLYFGSSSSDVSENIEYLGEDGTTVKKTYNNTLSNRGWKANDISKTEAVAGVRYIKIYGSNKWIVMSAFSVTTADETVLGAKVKTNGAGWTSYTPTQNATVATGAKAYIITAISGTTATTTEVTTMKAGEGYFIKGAANTEYVVTYTDANADDVTGSLLRGCLNATNLAANTTPYNYVLGTQTVNEVKKAGLFYVKTNAVIVPSSKCYLASAILENPQNLSIEFDEATAVEAIAEANEANAEAPVKVIKNGKLYIGNYNVAGQQVK